MNSAICGDPGTQEVKGFVLGSLFAEAESCSIVWAQIPKLKHTGSLLSLIIFIFF